jgi:hypothetical protein
MNAKRKSEKLTPWFPGNVPPARAGVYELRGSCDNGGQFARFENGVWYFRHASLQFARGESQESFRPTPRDRGLVDQWRGLAQEPK